MFVTVGVVDAKTVVKRQMSKEDTALWNGTGTNTFYGRTSSGSRARLSQIDWIGVDVSAKYGAKTSAAIQSALNTAGSNTAKFFFSPGAWTMGANVTFPNNIYLEFAPGAVFYPSGYTVTINSPDHIDAMPRQQIFSGDTVAFSSGGTLHVGWGGPSGDGATNDSTVLQRMIDMTPNRSRLVFQPLVYEISGNPGLSFNMYQAVTGTEAVQTIVDFNGAAFEYNEDNTAIRIGGIVTLAQEDLGTTSDMNYNTKYVGPVFVTRTVTQTTDGSATLASQKKGNGFLLQQCGDITFAGGDFYVKNFENGYNFSVHCTNIKMYDVQGHNNLIDFLFDPTDTNDNDAFTSAIFIYGAKTTMGLGADSTAWYSDIIGSRSVAIIEGDGTKDYNPDGISFIGGNLEGAKQYKVYSEGTEVVFSDIYWDSALAARTYTASGYDACGASTACTTDFYLDAEASKNIFRGGSTLVSHALADTGSNNSVIRQRDHWIGNSGERHFGLSAAMDMVEYYYQFATFADAATTSPQSATTQKSGFVEAYISSAPTDLGTEDNTTFTLARDVAYSTADTQWDITDSGDTCEYYFDGTGTDPGIAAGDVMDVVLVSGSGISNAGNKGMFPVIKTAASTITVFNTGCVTEANNTNVEIAVMPAGGRIICKLTETGGTTASITTTSHAGHIAIEGSNFSAVNRGIFEIIETGTDFIKFYTNTSAQCVDNTDKSGTVTTFLNEYGLWAFNEDTDSVEGGCTLIEGTTAMSGVYGTEDRFSFGLQSGLLKGTSQLHTTGKLMYRLYYQVDD